MRLLIPVFSPSSGTWGGITRVLAIAGTATRAGHEVAFCAAGDLQEKLRGQGYPVYSAPAATMLGLPDPISRLLTQRATNAALPVAPGKSVGDVWFVFFISGLARSGFLRRSVEAELEAISSFKPDMLFTDLNPGTYLVSAVTGLPLATAYQQIMMKGVGSWFWKRMRAATASVLKAYGRPALNPEDLFFGPSVLKIISSIPELDGADPGRPDVCYVGHLLGDVQPEASVDFRPEAKRYVFVYVGTGSIGLNTLRDVLPQVFPANGPQACVVGAPAIRETERIGGVEFRSYVPVEKLLPDCDWTICHGGQNTIIQSLRQIVPLIIFPGPIFERRFNARKVQDAGAGLTGELPDCTREWLSAVLPRRAEFAPKAAELGARIRSYGGAAAAVEAIERKCAAGHPLSG